MAKWSCNGAVSGGKHLGYVDAETEEEAIEKAWRLNEIYISLCHHCAGECEDAEVVRIDVYKEDEDSASEPAG